MSTKKTFCQRLAYLVLFYFASIKFVAAQNDITRTYASYFPFLLHDTVYVFNANTKIFKTPEAGSMPLLTVNIGDSLIILDSIMSVYSDVGLPKYYRVKAGKKIGFVEASNLSFFKYNVDTSGTFLLASFLLNDNMQATLCFREYYANIMTDSLCDELISQPITIKMTDNRGLSGIEHLIQVDRYARSCGEDGGITYYTYNHSDINQMARLFDVSDGGVYYFTETLIFPNDSGGRADTVVYRSVMWDLVDEATQWERKNEEVRFYYWDGALIPPFSRKTDYEMEEENNNSTDEK